MIRVQLKRVKPALVLVSVITLMFCVFETHAFAAKKVRWKVPIAFSSKLPGLGTTIVYASEKIKLMSDGQVVLKVYEPKKLLPPFEILEAVSKGKVKAGYTWVGYDSGKIASLPLFAAVPFGLEPWEFSAWYYERGGEKMLDDVYQKNGKNVHAVLCGLMGPETAGWYRFPIASLEDYKGLKIRFAGLGGKVLAKLGASVTMLPGGELYAALEKGTIDATEFCNPKIDQLLGFHKVVKYNLFPGWHQSFTAMHLLINDKSWNRLTEGQKALITTSCTAATMRGLSEAEASQGEVIANFPNQGVQTKTIPLPLLRTLKATTDEVMTEISAQDPDFKKIWNSQRAFAKNYALWKKLGYLPRDF